MAFRVRKLFGTIEKRAPGSTIAVKSKRLPHFSCDVTSGKGNLAAILKLRVNVVPSAVQESNIEN